MSNFARQKIATMEKWDLYDEFAEGNGMQVSEITDTYARTEMTVEQRHLNGVGVCQGGALFTLADLAMAAVTNQSGKSVSTDANIRFASPAKLNEHLVCECRIVRDGRLPILEGEIRCDERIVATFGGRDFKIN